MMMVAENVPHIDPPATGSATAAPSPAPAGPLLTVRNLTCTIDAGDRQLRLVDDVSFELAGGRTLGIVGESGSGKTMLVRSIMGIGPETTTVTGQVHLNGVDLMTLSPDQRRRRLGSQIAMVFQNPLTSLNPVVPIGRQITEAMRHHLGIGRDEARARAIELLEQVGISEPARRLKQYPFELSGGMRQRVTIAAALGSDPSVLIADEATTALDVTVQKQILVLLKEIQSVRRMAIVMITHDLGIVSGRADDLAVMYAGQMVEVGPTRTVFARHRHRYTEALLRSIPRLDDEPHSTFSTIKGSPPQPTAEFAGCRFAARCHAALDICRDVDPGWTHDDQAEDGAVVVSRHAYRCHNPAPTGVAV